MKASKSQLISFVIFIHISGSVHAETERVDSILQTPPFAPVLRGYIWASGSLANSGTASIAFTYPSPVSEFSYDSGSCDLQEQGTHLHCLPSESEPMMFSVTTSSLSYKQTPGFSERDTEEYIVPELPDGHGAPEAVTPDIFFNGQRLIPTPDLPDPAKEQAYQIIKKLIENESKQRLIDKQAKVRKKNTAWCPNQAKGG